MEFTDTSLAYDPLRGPHGALRVIDESLGISIFPVSTYLQRRARLLMGPVLASGVEGMYDRVRDPVLPKPGSVVYCDLLSGYLSHSGVMIDDTRIAQMDADGRIAAVSPEEFLRKTTGLSIRVSCLGPDAVGAEGVAARAETLVGKQYRYDIIGTNCHAFTCWALCGHGAPTLAMVRRLTEEQLGADNWRRWDL